LRQPLVEGAARPLVETYDTALLDLDGVVYLGERAVAGAPEALASVGDGGMRLAFVTNNASRTPGEVAEHLRAIGVPAAPQDVVTSAQAAAREVAQRVPAGAGVLVVGGEGLIAALGDHGLRAVSSADDKPAAVVQGFAPDVGWRLLTEGALAVSTGVPWVAANLDRTIPIARGTAPGNGTLVDAVAAAAGRRPDVVAGKPELPLHREAILRTGAQRPLVVGDRLDTDIEGANRAGTDSLLVLTGVAGPVDLLRADHIRRPTLVAAGLDGLLAAHPAVTRDDTGWRCGSWCARVVDGALRLDGDGDGDALEALRAAAVAVWSHPAPHAVEVTAAARAAGW
jgi:HAD superfamily hydrolase (TIGR01450 family)